MLKGFEEKFPGVVLACFVEGGYAGSYEIEGSDLDLVIVYAGGFDAALERQLLETLQSYDNESPVELDITLGSETFLYPPESYTGTISAQRLR